MRSLLPILLWKVQKFAMPVHDWRIAHLQVIQRALLDTSCATESQITATQKDSVPVNAKKSTNWAGVCGETGPNTGRKRVQLPTSILHIFTWQAKEAGFVGWCSKFAIKVGIHIPRVLLYTRFAEGLYVTLLANCTLPCTLITSSGNWTWVNGSSVFKSLHSSSCSSPQSQILCYFCLRMSVVNDCPTA